MTNYVSQPLNKGEVVYHINFIKNNNNNNRIENSYLYKNIGNHRKCTKSIFKLIKKLLELKIIIFENREYKFNLGGLKAVGGNHE